MSKTMFKISVTPYDGNPDTLNTFLLQCDAQFDFNADAFKDDAKKIHFLLTKCKGGIAAPWAAAWFASSFTAYTTTTPPGTWADFITILKQQFLPQDITASALA